MARQIEGFVAESRAEELSAEEHFNLRRRERLTKEITLKNVTAKNRQCESLLIQFHALCDHFQANGMREVNHGLHNCGIHFIHA